MNRWWIAVAAAALGLVAVLTAAMPASAQEPEPVLISAGDTISVPAGGTFVSWTFDDASASDVFGDLDVAWLWDDGAWTSFAPVLGITDFTVEFGDVLFLGSDTAVEVAIPAADRFATPQVFQLATPAGAPAPSREPSAEEIARGVPADAVCFDVDLVDVATGEVIGSGTDCLFEITALEEGGVRLSAQTTFNLPEGSFTSEGLTTVQGITTGVPSGAGGELTHITGAIPVPGENSIIEGTGAYADFSATVRLSGSANLGGAEGAEPFPATMGFDCIFIITSL